MVVRRTRFGFRTRRWTARRGAQQGWTSWSISRPTSRIHPRQFEVIKLSFFPYPPPLSSPWMGSDEASMFSFKRGKRGRAFPGEGRDRAPPPPPPNSKQLPRIRGTNRVVITIGLIKTRLEGDETRISSSELFFSSTPQEEEEGDRIITTQVPPLPIWWYNIALYIRWGGDDIHKARKQVSCNSNCSLEYPRSRFYS